MEGYVCRLSCTYGIQRRDDSVYPMEQVVRDAIDRGMDETDGRLVGSFCSGREYDRKGTYDFREAI